MNLLTLPQLKATIGLGGLGDGVTDLRHVEWLTKSELWYWGDLDAEGLLILARLRVRDFDLAAWTGLFGPASMPKDITDKLSATLLQIMAKPAVIERLNAAGAEPTPSDAATFSALVKRQLELWGRKVRDAGIQPE